MENKTPYARRSKDDEKWQQTKSVVDKRDRKQCRFMKCISLKESHQLSAGSERTLDRAHIFAASAEPNKIYNPNNVVTLIRWAHRRMDEYRSPLTGDPVELNEHFYWWMRIYFGRIEDYDPDIDYEEILRKEIH